MNTKAPQDILTAVPGNAWAAFCVPSLSGLESKLMMFSQQLNLPVPGSPLMMAKMMTQMSAGVNDDGGLAVVLMPTTDISSIGQSLVVMVPTNDYAALTTGLSSEAVDGNVSWVYLMGQRSFIAPYGKFAAIAQSRDALDAVLRGTSTMGSQLGEHQRKRLAADDLILWINVAAITSGELYGGFAPMLEMYTPNAGAMKELRSAQLSLRIEPAGITIGGYADAQPGSDTAKAMGAPPSSSRPLLTGLPATPFALAAGWRNGVEEAKHGARSVDEMLKMLAEADDETAKLFAELRPMLRFMVRSMRGGAMSIYSLPDDADGLIGMHAIIETDGAAKEVCKAVGDLLAVVKKSAASCKSAAISEMIQHSPGKETIAGVSVDHLRMITPDDVDDAESKSLAMIVGGEGLLFRIAAVDKSRVAVSFGGGTAAAGKLCETIKANGSPLSENAGIKKVSGRFPALRNSEAYLAADRVVKLIGKCAAAGGEPFPYTLDATATPLAICASPAGVAGRQTDVFIATDLIKAIKSTVEGAMGMGVAGGPAVPAEN